MVRALVLCSLLLCLAACEEPPFRVVAQIDGSWLLSVTADDERVLCAGGRPGQGMTPGEGLVARLRGTAAPLEPLKSPVPGMLWWVHNLGGGVAWFAGEAGVVLRYDEGAGAQPLSLVPTGKKAVLYGLWAFSDSDVWAVGGDDQQGGVILHGDRGGLAIDGSAPRTGARAFRGRTSGALASRDHVPALRRAFTAGHSSSRML